MAKEDLHYPLCRDYESCLPSILAKFAGYIHSCGAVYYSDVVTQLEAYELTVQQMFHSILASLDRILVNVCSDNAPADLQ